ncbi:MAG: hypothetical protein JXQ90_01060 [Cyclobacteriaceae bacterium]
MKFIVRLFLIAICSYFLPQFSPWWIIFIYSFLVGYLIPGNGFNVFNAGFLGAGLVWLGLAFKINNDSGAFLADKIVALMPFSDPNLLILATGLIGALSAAVAAQCGNSFRQIFMKKKKKSLYS